MGRIFSGKRAHNDISIPLVDVNGGLQTAINLAKSAAGLENQKVDIIEYPQKEDKFIKMVSKLNVNKYSSLVPDELADELKVFDVIPILLDNEILMLLPHTINVK